MIRDPSYLLSKIDAAKAALVAFDFRGADRIRNELYASGVAFSWFTAELIGDQIARSREEARKLERLREFA